jgi:hypothetical protein
MGSSAKRVYFFNGPSYLRYDADLAAVPPGYPKTIADVWSGLFATDIDAAINWGNGNVYFFSGSEYSQYNVLSNAVTAGYPKDIGTNWPGTAGTGFDTGIDAAVNWGNGTSFLFKGDQYLRYNNVDDKADAGYPKPIAGNWPGISGTGFESGIDAAINYGNGFVYWFKGDQYIKIQLANKTIEAGYPKPVAGNWPGVTTPISAAVEWPYAELAPNGFNVPANRSLPGQQPAPTAARPDRMRDGEQFNMELDFVSAPFPAACAVGEYRQLVRGRIVINTVTIPHDLAPSTGFSGGTPQRMRPRPAAGSATEDFTEDGMQELTTDQHNLRYGYRQGWVFATDVYQPDRQTGCQYRGFDFPGVFGVPGDTYTVDLDFRGQAIDRGTTDRTTNAAEVLFSVDWNVNISGRF